MARGGTSKGALAALGLAGLVWAYKNRDKISQKVNEYRGQMQEQQGRSFEQPRSSTHGQSDFPRQTSLGDNFDAKI